MCSVRTTGFPPASIVSFTGTFVSGKSPEFSTVTTKRRSAETLIVVAVFQVLHIGAAAVGYMTAAIGVGGLVGALRGMTLRKT